MDKRFWIEFIALYRYHDALWCEESENYKSQRLRDIGFGSLLEKYQEIEPNALLSDVKKRIQAMRSCYRRELKRVRESEANSISSEDIHVPKLWYFNELDFLRNRNLTSSATYPDCDSLEELEVSIEIAPQQLHKKFNEHRSPPEVFKPNKLKKRHTDFEEVDGDSDVKNYQSIDDMPEFPDIFSDESNEIPPAKRRETRDDAEVFSESWAVLFRKCSPEQQIYAKRAIEEILLLGQLEKLSFKSYRFDT